VGSDWTIRHLIHTLENHHVTYQQAAELFEHVPTLRPGCEQYALIKCGDDYGILLHSTVVVRFVLDGGYVLRRMLADRHNETQDQ
jgi:hypothetical protein